MDLRIVERNGIQIAVIDSAEPMVTDTQSALDLFMTILFEHGVSRIALSKEAVDGRFFDLSTRMAGDILQKVVNYHMKLAIFGDFAVYSSKALKDFIFESNAGNAIYFMPDEQAAIERLSR